MWCMLMVKFGFVFNLLFVENRRIVLVFDEIGFIWCW